MVQHLQKFLSYLWSYFLWSWYTNTLTKKPFLITDFGLCFKNYVGKKLNTDMGKQQVKLLTLINYQSKRTKMFFDVEQNFHQIKSGNHCSSIEDKEKIRVQERQL